MNQNNILTFTIKNNGNLDALYNVYIEETSTNPEFKNVIRYASSKDNGVTYTKAKTLSENKYIEQNGIININEEITYKVKVWLKETADNTYMNKTFTAKIVVESLQTQPVTVTFDANIFSSRSFTQDGLIVSYESDTSILTLNGHSTSSSVLLTLDELNNVSFNEGDEYLIKTKYISGAVTGEGISTIAAEVYKNDNVLTNRNYFDIPFGSYDERERTSNVTSYGASEGNKLKFNIWIKNGLSAYIFDNYKVQINFKKIESKQVFYGLKYGELPTPTKAGYTFIRWERVPNYELDEIYIVADANFNYNSRQLINVKKNILDAKLNSGTATEFSTVFGDLTLNSTSPFSNGWINKPFGDNVEIIYTTPSTVDESHNLAILLYAGVARQTAGNSVTYSNIRIFENVADYYITSSTIVSDTNNHTLKAIWKENE